MPCAHLRYKNPEASVSTHQKNFLTSEALLYTLVGPYIPTGRYYNSRGHYVRRPRGIKIKDPRNGQVLVIDNCAVASARIREALREIDWPVEYCDGCNEEVPVDVRGRWKKRDIRRRRARFLGITVNGDGRPVVATPTPAPVPVRPREVPFDPPTPEESEALRFLAEIASGVRDRSNVYIPRRTEHRPDMPNVYLELEGFSGSCRVGAFRYLARERGLEPRPDSYGFRFRGANYRNNYDAYQWALGVLRSQGIHSKIITQEVS